MVANKDRVYLTLFARSKSGTYHWGITRSPKYEGEGDELDSSLYHVRNLPGENASIYWEYEMRRIRSKGTRNSLVRIHISKIDPRNVERMEEALADVELIQDDPSWTCRSWVRDAVAELGRQGLIRRWDWSTLESKALWYVQKKIDEGRFAVSGDGNEEEVGIATFD